MEENVGDRKERNSGPAKTAEVIEEIWASVSPHSAPAHLYTYIYIYTG